MLIPMAFAFAGLIADIKSEKSCWVKALSRFWYVVAIILAIQGTI